MAAPITVLTATSYFIFLRWFKAIDERPAVKAALAKIAIIKSSRDTASADHKDRFFNRGRYARA